MCRTGLSWLLAMGSHSHTNPDPELRSMYPSKYLCTWVMSHRSLHKNQRTQYSLRSHKLENLYALMFAVVRR